MYYDRDKTKILRMARKKMGLSVCCQDSFLFFLALVMLIFIITI